MHRSFLIIGFLLAALSICLGAFGAHALKSVLGQEKLISFETAVRYQMYHAFAIIIVGILFKNFNRKLLLWSGRLFFVGIILFSGSLYLPVSIENYRWIGIVTPFGGIAFVLGWLLAAIAVLKKP